jgi:hypothetical protein
VRLRGFEVIGDPPEQLHGLSPRALESADRGGLGHRLLPARGRALAASLNLLVPATADAMEVVAPRKAAIAVEVDAEPGVALRAPALVGERREGPGVYRRRGSLSGAPSRRAPSLRWTLVRLPGMFRPGGGSEG